MGGGGGADAVVPESHCAWVGVEVCSWNVVDFLCGVKTVALWSMGLCDSVEGRYIRWIWGVCFAVDC